MSVPQAVGTALAIVLLGAGVYWLANRQVYHPAKYPRGPWEVQQQLGARDVWLQTPDGLSLHAWWVEAAGGPVTLFLHGNAGNIAYFAEHLRAIAEAGSSVLGLDYRGFGKSQGSPSEEGLYQDAQAAYEWLRRRHGPSDHLIVHGQSLGTAVAVHLAASSPVAGVILESPFTSIGDVAHLILPYLGPLLVGGFDSASKIARIDAPLLILHGDQDDLIPCDMGQRLYDLAKEPKTFREVEGAGHGNLLAIAGRRYVQWLQEFYAALPESF